jgi:Polyketide cyclase / dehydrase and lipid transport
VTRNRVSIKSPPHDVYAVLMDAYAYSDWVVGSKRVRSTDPNWPEVGARFFHTVGPPAVDIDDSSKLVELVEDRRVALEVRFRPVGIAVVGIDIEGDDAGRHTRVTMTEEPKTGPVRAWWAKPVEVLLHGRNALSLWRLARLCEKRTSAARHVPGAA